MQKIIPHLWFDKEANEGSKFYLSLFEKSELQGIPIFHEFETHEKFESCLL